MTLSQTDINKAALIAALFVKERSRDELSQLARELSVPEKYREFTSGFQVVLARIHGFTQSAMSIELTEEIVRRIRSNVQIRLKAPEVQPKPPPSEEIDALCETSARTTEAAPALTGWHFFYQRIILQLIYIRCERVQARYTSCVHRFNIKRRRYFLFVATCVVLLGVLGLFYISQEEVRTPAQNALYRDPSLPIETRVADLLSYMTLAEKIGQMTLVEKDSLRDPDDITAYHIGALLSGSGAKPEINTPEEWEGMIGRFQEAAAQSRLGIPLLYGTDAIHGHAHVLGNTVFPHAIGLGAAGDPMLVQRVARATAEEIAASGANWNFAPNLDAPHDIRWGRVYEAFSDDPALISILGSAYVEGLQSATADTRILSTLKHYVGVGSMGWDTSLNKNFKIDQGVTQADSEALHVEYLPPFEAAIDAGALSIMAGLNTWGTKRIAYQKTLLTDVLKNDLGFKGFIVSDWYGVHEGRKNIFAATVSAVNAGVDMVMLPFDYETFVWHMKLANRLGLVSTKRIDDAVSRILYAKFALGLFDEKTKGGIFDERAKAEHQALAREAVARSLVLLKNEGGLLPINASAKHIRVAGSAADNIGMQMGAWSIEWQGVDGNWPPLSTSILEGIRVHAPFGTEIEYEISGDFSSSDAVADIGIAIVGEKPYAEGWGDTAYPTLSNEDLRAIKNLQKSSKKVVVIIVSGRPLLIEHEIDSFDALIAAWLPGSEGAGVADVLFGDVPFAGTLPLPWPLRSEQLPISVDGGTADGTSVLFPRHFGITQ